LEKKKTERGGEKETGRGGEVGRMICEQERPEGGIIGSKHKHQSEEKEWQRKVRKKKKKKRSRKDY